MIPISRRSFLSGAATISAGCAAPFLLGGAAADANPAIFIIDASVDTSPFVDQLELAGVQVVARYLSRRCQTKLMKKRIAFNPPQDRTEECHLNKMEDRTPEYGLLLRKFALLSIYQYQNDNPAKFVHGLADAQDLVRRAIQSGAPRRLAAARIEAQLDAEAARKQAKRISQPETSPIYFGVDFNMKTSGNVSDLHDNNVVDAKLARECCIEYFRTLKQILGDRLGVYGNGLINRILRQEGYVRFSWVSESRSFAETPELLRDGFSLKTGEKAEWHLFQHLINATWHLPKAPEPLELDGNVNNPFYEDFGAWTADGPWKPDIEKSRSILKGRRVAKRNAPIFPKPSLSRACGVMSPGGQFIAAIGYHRSVRVIGNEIEADGRKWLHVDINEDGRPDGYCLASDFVGGIKAMPDFVLAEFRTSPKDCM